MDFTSQAAKHCWIQSSGMVHSREPASGGYQGSSVMHFLFAAVSLDSEDQPCLRPSLLRLGMLLKFRGWDAAFIFLPQSSRFVFISVHLLLPLEIVSFSFARNFQTVLIYAPGIC